MWVFKQCCIVTTFFFFLFWNDRAIYSVRLSLFLNLFFDYSLHSTFLVFQMYSTADTHIHIGYQLKS